MRLLREWTPGHIRTPSLLIEAQTPLFPGGDDERWKEAGEAVQVAADHFTIIESEVGLVASASGLPPVAARSRELLPSAVVGRGGARFTAPPILGC
jgi:hypothetical protein